MTIRFAEEAQREFLEAISDYEEARGGLGRRFKDEVERGSCPGLACLRAVGAHSVRSRPGTEVRAVFRLPQGAFPLPSPP